MTKIVYADPSYIPPRGVVVLPLDAHPSIVEDRALGLAKPTYPATPQPLGDVSNPTTQQIVAILRCGSATAAELAARIGVRRQTVDGKLRCCPHLFEVVGQRRTGIHGPLSAVWALRGQP